VSSANDVGLEDSCWTQADASAVIDGAAPGGGVVMESTAGGVLAIAPQLDPVTRLLAMVAAVFSVETAGLHRALARRMRAFLRV
jgi:hypothetical protein